MDEDEVLGVKSPADDITSQTLSQSLICSSENSLQNSGLLLELACSQTIASFVGFDTDQAGLCTMYRCYRKFYESFWFT